MIARILWWLDWRIHDWGFAPAWLEDMVCNASIKRSDSLWEDGFMTWGNRDGNYKGAKR